jgi:hypothetical protein
MMPRLAAQILVAVVADQETEVGVELEVLVL